MLCQGGQFIVGPQLWVNAWPHQHNQQGGLIDTYKLYLLMLPQVLSSTLAAFLVEELERGRADVIHGVLGLMVALSYAIMSYGMREQTQVEET
jgi:hypothetical protein